MIDILVVKFFTGTIILVTLLTNVIEANTLIEMFDPKDLTVTGLLGFFLWYFIRDYNKLKSEFQKIIDNMKKEFLDKETKMKAEFDQKEKDYKDEIKSLNERLINNNKK